MTSMHIQIVPYKSPAYEEMKHVREEILRAPLGFTLSPEDTEGEEKQIHIAAVKKGNAVVGTIVIKFLDDNTLKLRQIAVVPNLQGRGIGRDLVRFAERIAAAKGCHTIELTARVSAEEFYEKLGYQTTGEQFIDLTIPFIKMTKIIIGNTNDNVLDLANQLKVAVGTPGGHGWANPITRTSLHVLAQAGRIISRTDGVRFLPVFQQAFSEGVQSFIDEFSRSGYKDPDAVLRNIEHFSRYCADIVRYEYLSIIAGLKPQQLQSIMQAFREWPIAEIHPRQDNMCDHSRPFIIHITNFMDQIINIAAAVADHPNLAAVFREEYNKLHAKNITSINNRLGFLIRHSTAFSVSEETFQNMRSMGMNAVDVMRPIRTTPKIEFQAVETLSLQLA
jgi:GNAT superfamily N-acetyltransferase